MARGRMISKTLGTSKRFAKLGTYDHGEFYQLLFPLLVSFTDDFGRVEGDSFSVKFRVFPVSPRTEDEFESALLAMCKVGLLQRYHIGEECIIQIAQWEEHQQGLHKRTKSKFPGPPGGTADAPVEPMPTGKHPEREFRLVSAYPTLYLELVGQPYIQNKSQRERDIDAARALCEAYDGPSLEKIIRMYLTVDEDNPKARLIRGSQRTLPKLLTMAGSLADALKVTGHGAKTT